MANGRCFIVSFFILATPFSTLVRSQTPVANRERVLVEALVRLQSAELAKDPKVEDVLRRHIESQQEKDPAEVVRVIQALELADYDKRLLAIALDETAEGAGLEAVKMLLDKDPSALEDVLESKNPLHILAAVRVLGLVRDRASVGLLAPLIRSKVHDRSTKVAAARALTSSIPGQRRLLRLAREGQLPAEAEFAVTNALLSSRNPEIRNEAKKSLILSDASATPLPTIDQLVRRSGNVDRGKKVFETTGNCAKCHVVNKQGKEVGPDLSEIGSKLSRTALFESILDPSAGISHNYESYLVQRDDGRVVSGVVQSKTDEAVTLKTAEAILVTIPTKEIEKMIMQDVSLMPADLRKTHSIQDLVDVVDYMSVLRKEDQSGLQETVGTSVITDRSPGKSTQRLTVADGLQVSLFASEPMLGNPSNIDIDHLGRVWVCEIVNYRNFGNPDNPVRETGDRILVLEDRDEDGLADKSTVFYEGRDIDSPHGICVLGDRVIVSAGEHVFVLIDEDGDLKADGKQVMFSGISGVQHDHGIHAFVFGPDGRLYFNFGNEGQQLKNANGQAIVDLAGNKINHSGNPYRQGMVFRCDLDGKNVETLAWNFRNNWEVCVDSFGAIWQSDNDDDGHRATRINYIMEYGNYGYVDEMTGAGWREPRVGMHDEVPFRHWHLNDPGVVPNLLHTGAGSPTGILVYEGKLLPKRFQNQMIHCDAGPSVVRCYPIRKQGAGFSAEAIPVLEGTGDNWFRPSDVCVAPDGSLIVADWYDPGVGGHRMGDVQRGRLFRVTPQGHVGYKFSPLKLETIAGAIAGLNNPNLATRFLAWQTLHRAGEDAQAELNEIVATSRDDRYRARAIWLLAQIKGSAQAAVQRALSDDSEDIRATAIRIARQTRLSAADWMGAATKDTSLHVKREALVGLRDSQDKRFTQWWVNLADAYDGKDRWYLEALGMAAEGRWDSIMLVLSELRGMPELAFRELVWRSRTDRSAKHLAAAITAADVSAGDQLRYFRAVDFLSAAARQQALLDIVEHCLP